MTDTALAPMDLFGSTGRLYQGEWPEGAYRFFQIAYVVPDLIAACERWSRVYGVGPFHVLPARVGKVFHRGTERDVELRLATTQAGPVQIELIEQVSDGPSIYRDVYAGGTGGFHHIGLITHDFDATGAHFESLGYEKAAALQAGDMRVAYFDTVRDFGFVTEVIEYQEGFASYLARHSDTCRDWSGNDPVRILTRDGYRVPGAGDGSGKG